MLLDRNNIFRYQDVSGSHIELEEIQDMIDNEPIVSTISQLEVNKLVESNDIALCLHKI